ncbi:MAG: OmpA family protein [Balneolaceae bacterium]|nr:OmpA family protein [Balneolaceae bacterium]
MKTYYKLLLVVLLLPLLVVSTANAQDEDQVPDKLSIGLLGGITQGHMNIGTEYDPTFGFNFRYAANPTIAAQLNFSFGTMTTNPDDDNYFEREFENSYITTSMTAQIDILRLLGSTSENVKLYTSVGLGLIFSDVTTEVNNKEPSNWTEYIGEDHSEPSMFASFGPGVRFNLGRRIDLFAQYDYYISNSEIIDGFRTRPELDIDLHRRTPDNWSSVTAGIQIKFGSSDKDADWHTYTPGVDPSALDNINSRLDDLDDRVTDNTSRIDDNQEYLEMLEERMDEFEDRLNNLEQMLQDMDRVEMTISNDVLFAFDSSVIRESAKPTLAKIARALNNHPDRTLNVAGHTCDIGTEEYNEGLSERRAAAVKEYLVKSGISGDRIMTEAYGESEPLVPNENEAARKLNRRVELTIE